MLIGRWDAAVRVHAPAKVNLFLEVLGRRPDGYHDLATLMVAVSLYDTLELRPPPAPPRGCAPPPRGAFGPPRVRPPGPPPPGPGGAAPPPPRGGGARPPPGAGPC